MAGSNATWKSSRRVSPFRFEQELVATGRHLELAACRVEPASRREVAVLFKDVTARKQAERALQELNETLEARIAAALEERKKAEDALRQAQKMEAVGQLTGGLAHDSNNLLAGISGAFQMIGVRLAQGRTRDVEKYVSAGEGAARRAASLTHRLLAFSRRQTLSPRAIVINRLMSDFVELVRRTVGPSIEVETIEAGGLWPTMVDANQLENAMLVADAALTLRSDLKVLFITGHAENAAFNHGHIGPGMELLTKPFAIEDLGRRVERMLRRNN